MGKKEKEQSEMLRRFLDREPGAEPPEDRQLLRIAQLLDAGAPEAEENSSRRKVWAKVSQEITPAPSKARRWPWWPASTLAFSGAAVAVFIAVAVFGAYLLSSSSSTASAEEIVRKAQAVAIDPSASGVQSYEMNLKTLATDGLPEESSSETHIWHLAPDHWRLEAADLVSVGDGETVWEYVPAENLVRISSGKLDGPRPESTGLDAFIGERISEGNQPALMADGTVAGRGAYVVSLTVPKGSLTLWVDKETFFVLRSVLYTLDGATYTTEATFVRYNEAFSAAAGVGVGQGSLFTFVPPEGATVQDLRIGEPAGRPTPPAGPLPTLSPGGEDTSTWSIYRNDAGKFELRYPSDGRLQTEEDGSDRIDLTFDTGSNLSEKYVLISAGSRCARPFDPEPLETGWIAVNRVAFLKQVRSGVAAGNLYESATYTAANGGVCVSLSFVLHSVSPGNFPSPMPTFNHVDEAGVFDAILSTFALTE